ncbi:hypothetical protein ACSBR1_000688 [Camellia fascicularis]
MSKFTTLLLVIALLLSPMLTYASAARPEPVKTKHMGSSEMVDNEETNCEGVKEEECLMRRTLVAHIDYIYTQKQHKP